MGKKKYSYVQTVRQNIINRTERFFFGHLRLLVEKKNLSHSHTHTHTLEHVERVHSGGSSHSQSSSYLMANNMSGTTGQLAHMCVCVCDMHDM